jgi:hypothetical protein
MRFHELLLEQNNFFHFIGDLMELWNKLNAQIRTNPQYVIGAARRAIRRLRAHRSADDIEANHIELAIEMFEDLIRRSGGQPLARSRQSTS